MSVGPAGSPWCAGNIAENVAINTTDVVTNVATSVSTSVNRGLDGIIPSDNDFADVDIYGGGSVDQLFINRDGVISYDPGDDVFFEDILNGSGNNAFVFNQVNDLVDNDGGAAWIGEVSGGNGGFDGMGGTATTGAGGMWGSNNGDDGYVTGS